MGFNVISLQVWKVVRSTFFVFTNLFQSCSLPGHPKVPCFLEVFCYFKPTKKHGTVGCLGMGLLWVLCGSPSGSNEALGPWSRWPHGKDAASSWFDVQRVQVLISKLIKKCLRVAPSHICFESKQV